MKPIILFGGSFDPIHEGHLLIAMMAMVTYDAKKVIFIPSKTPHKTYLTTSSQRKKMFKLFLEERCVGENEYEASFYELNQKSDCCYTIDTILHFKEKYPKEKFIFLIGEDKLASLPDWKEIEKISKLVKLVCVSRESCLEQYEETIDKFSIELLSLPNIPISSSLIREGKSLLTSKSVLDYIADNELYFCKDIAGMEHHHRYLHSVSVAKTAYKIAIRNDLDPFIAYQAGLFHDCGKDLPVEEQRKIVHEHFSQYEPLPDFALHQFVGAYLAETKFGITNPDILESIAFHCTGKGDMSDMQKVIYAADKVEPTRQFETKIGRKACYKDIESGFVTALKEQIKYFKERNMTFKDHFLSKQMYEQYLGE